MTTLHVATDGDDSKDGSASSPLRTISRAADLARPGDTVLVHGGEYRESVTAAARRAECHAAHHLPGRARRARRGQGIGAGDGLEAGSGERAAAVGAQLAVRRLEPLRAGDRGRLARRAPAAAGQAPRRDLPERAQLLRGGHLRRGDRPAAAHRGHRPLDAHDRPGAQPRADPARLVRRGRRGHHDGLGQLRRRRPQRRARGDQRAQVGVLPRRAPTSTTSPYAASSSRRRPARGPRPLPTSPGSSAPTGPRAGSSRTT